MTIGTKIWVVLFVLASSVTLLPQATRIHSSGTLPNDCVVGNIYQKTGSSAGIYFCSATNTWTLLSASGSGAPSDATYITQTANGTLSAEQALGALSTGLMKVTTTTGAISTAAAGTDYTSPSSTDTLINKTIDAEGTGNAITIPFTFTFVVGVCQNTTASLGLSLPASDPAVAACVTGTNTQFSVAQFADSADLSAQGHFSLPADWTGAIDVKGKWRTSATSGDVVWQVQTICVADAETSDPSFNTASTTTDTAKGTTLQQNDFSITGVTATGCAAGEELYFKIRRDSAHASDSLAATAELISLVFTVRRGM